MAACFGFAPAKLRCCVQVHETRIAVVEEGHTGQRLEGFDGAVTATPGVPLMTFSADCPLVLVYDPDTARRWRGACKLAQRLRADHPAIGGIIGRTVFM